ncbi:hypothetical protein SteCoe_8626 [Stentor coeruleus]|uniref:Uncharacterized protein n=1 Tax=Stentor coeruleus TaxID=5963 RepID=A0A1R2CJQ0_9CILI|nr:hypothetical protein SteCoe_8626 [Stentor coeruleus]
MHSSYSQVTIEAITQISQSKLIGITTEGQILLKSSKSESLIPLSLLCNHQGLPIKDFVLYFYIGKGFSFNTETKTLNTDFDYTYLVDLYKKDHVFSSRVCFKDTKLPQHQDFIDFFVSNKYFCTKEAAIMLGFLESVVRFGASEDILNKLVPERKIILKDNFKDIFELIFPDGKEDIFFRLNFLAKYIEYDLNNPGSVQKLADNLSIGITILSLKCQNNYSKYTILPSKPEMLPIPIIKLLTHKDSVFLLYSNNENYIDGYDDQGNIKKLYTHQGCPESFYPIKNIIKPNLPNEILTSLSYVIKDLCHFTRDELNLANKLEKVIEKLQPNNSDLEKCLRNFQEAKNFLSKKRQSSLSRIKNLPQITDKKVPTNSKSFEKLEKKRFLSPVILKSTDKNMSVPLSQSSISPTNPISININPSPSPLPIMRETKGKNYTIKTGNPCFNPQNKNQNIIFVSNGKNKKDKIPKLKKCTNCKRTRKTISLHGDCKLCQKCILQTFDNEFATCIGCGEKVEQLRGKFISRYQFTCEMCFKSCRMPLILPCGCVICGNPCNVIGHTCVPQLFIAKQILQNN